MQSFTRHASDPAPQYIVPVDQNQSPTLIRIVWWVVEWSTDLSLFLTQNQFGRDSGNFHPLDSTSQIVGTLQRDHVVALPAAIWRQWRSDVNNRHLYLRVGSGFDADPSHASWTWVNLAAWTINHDPKADPGPPINAEVGIGSLTSGLELDASSSWDPDLGTQLSHDWRLVSVPTGCLTAPGGWQLSSTIQQSLSAGGATPVFLSAGSQIPQDCQGLYRVELVTTDDDPPSFYGTVGRSVAELDVVLGSSCDNGICLDSPAPDQKAFIETPGKDEVRIQWRLSSGVFSAWQSAPGARLMVSIQHENASPGDPPAFVTFDFRPRPSASVVWRGFTTGGGIASSGYYDVRIEILDAQGNLLAAPQPTNVEASRVIAVSQIGFWADLISFRPPRSIQPRVHEPFVAGGFHAIEDAYHGSTNLDYFPVEISQMPLLQGQRATPEALLEYIRLHLNNFVDTNISEFLPYGSFPATEAMRWQNSPMGSLISIDLYLGHQPFSPDDGSVMCTLYESRRWRFSTLFTLLDSGHPVSGNREWGIRDNPDGSQTFYTRAADRATTFFDQPFLVYPGGDGLWRSLVRKTAAFINSNGGAAMVGEVTALRPDWAVASLYYHPTESWLPGVRH